MNEALQKGFVPILALILGAGGSHWGTKAVTHAEADREKRELRAEMKKELREEIALENRLTAVESKAQKNWDLLYSVRSRLGME